MSNWDRVNKGFDLLLVPLLRYELKELEAAYGRTGWWDEGIVPILTYEQKRNVGDLSDDKKRIASIDIALALRILDVRWGDVFRRRLPRDCRTWANELKGDRADAAHRGVGDLSDDDAFRALDTMQRLCSEIDNEKAEPIRALMREIRYGSAAGSAQADVAPAQSKAHATSTSVLTVGELPSWRDVVTPHPDVAEGRYRNAEFAADLAQVARNAAAQEYQDPVEFFSRTYMTAGIRGLLSQALLRVSGRGGEPVIQLKTAFGGGKTHSMLALYHLMHGGFDTSRVPNVKKVLGDVGLSEAPNVHVAVVVGTALDPSKASRPQNMPGITVNTVWGEIAYQLALAAGDPALYDFVKEADKKHVSPGSEALTALFDAAGPCLVLIDELVAYAKKLYGVGGLPAGSFDNLVTFIQELTEAARASKASLVVASIPESEREIGGDAGKLALEAIEHTFGRMESIWNPVTASEGFSVVSRRLFSSQVDEGLREKVCRAFAQMYRDNPDDFPVEAHDPGYLERMVDCYPIHPEVYDRLYEDWASIDGFQRTRGVLRFMASVIHELWVEGDKAPMIMVGSIPFDVPGVRDELTRYLPDTWSSVVDSEVDGRNSEPYKADSASPRYGRCFACRRAARAVFMGSAPDVAGQSGRGIEKANVYLGVLQPGDNPPLFSDALATLRTRSSYLYANDPGTRYWYDTRPTLCKMVEGLAKEVSDSEVAAEIERRLRTLRPERPIAGLHVCPRSTTDVPDEQKARLVLFGPDVPYGTDAAADQATDAAREYLAGKGAGQRMYRNCLVFLAPDSKALPALKEEVRRYLAWRSVQGDSDRLDLTSSQQREVSSGITVSSQVVDVNVNEVYGWLLVPRVDTDSGSMETVLDVQRVPAAGEEDPVSRAARKLQGDESLIGRLAPLVLKMSLDRWLWRDAGAVQVKQLWSQLCSYCYLPRLADFSVLEATIREGATSGEFFGIAAGIEGERYVDLTLAKERLAVHETDWLVKPEAARAQLEREQAESEFVGPACTPPSDKPQDELPYGGSEEVPPTTGPGGSRGTDDGEDGGAQPVEAILDKRLDSVRVNRDIAQIVEEVVSHLERSGASVEMSLHVEARNSQGFDAETVRTVTENCRTLGIECELNE